MYFSVGILGTQSKSTYVYDLKSNTWNPGPNMNQARAKFGCGRFFNEYSNEHHIMAVGGENIDLKQSVEFLEESSGKWFYGNKACHKRIKLDQKDETR